MEHSKSTKHFKGNGTEIFCGRDSNGFSNYFINLMGIKFWSTQWAIQQRVNLEAMWEWAKTENPPLPKFEKPKIEKLNGGMWNFIKSNVYEFRP